jgi:hypothetical protein
MASQKRLGERREHFNCWNLGGEECSAAAARQRDGHDLLPENWTNGGWRDLTGEVPKKGPNGEAKAA